LERHAHVVVPCRRRDPHPDVRAPHFAERLENLEQKARAVLLAPSPLVCAFVGAGVEELMREVAVGAMDWGLSLVNSR
jgi:hypothetical protein